MPLKYKIQIISLFMYMTCFTLIIIFTEGFENLWGIIPALGLFNYDSYKKNNTCDDK